MENVLTAIFVMFLIIFGGLRLTDHAISSQEQISETWHEVMDARTDTANTAFTITASQVTASDIEFTLVNEGSTRLSDFDRWDVIVTYYDNGGNYRIEYLPYSINSAASTWSLVGIYLDTEINRVEVFDRGVWNPEEELKILVRPTVSLGTGEALHIVIASQNGMMTDGLATRNAPPQLANNSPLNITTGEHVTIDSAHLRVTDTDNADDDLIYTIITGSNEGYLIPAATFTQEQLNQGLVTYTHTGLLPGSDTFQFTVTDGEDTIGAYSFTITIGA